jgi:hypothetical protein
VKKHLNWCEKVQSTVKRYHVSQGTCPQKVKNATVITKIHGVSANKKCAKQASRKGGKVTHLA